MYRDASDSGKFKLFDSVQAEPTTTVNTAATGYAKATLVTGPIDVTTAAVGSTLAVTGNTALTGKAELANTLSVTGVTTLSEDLDQADNKEANVYKPL